MQTIDLVKKIVEALEDKKAEDYIEPNRCEAPRLEEIRKLAFSDLDRTVAEILYDTINFLNTKSGAIDPTTQITYNYYAKYRDNREE